MYTYALTYFRTHSRFRHLLSRQLSCIFFCLKEYTIESHMLGTVALPKFLNQMFIADGVTKHITQSIRPDNTSSKVTECTLTEY